MFPIEQSAFLQALGRAIGNSLWQVAAIWLINTAITGLLTLSASRKYQIATIASMVGFLWFASTFFYTYTNAPLYSYSSVYTFAEANENINRTVFVNQVLYLYHSVLASLKSLSPYISCAYILVFLLLGVRLVNGFRQVKFFATQGLGKVDVQWRLFVQQNAEILQIKQKVKVFTSHYVQSPLTMGFWKPIILLPLASLNNLNTQQVEAILLHELAHIRRHDYLINIFVQIAEMCLFFNPFMRLLLKQIKQERENSCDDYVLQFQYNATDYVKALLTIEKNNSATLLALSANDNQSFQLLNRVKRMVAPQPHAFNYRQQLYMLLLLTILGLGFTVIVPQPKIKNPVASVGHHKNSSAQNEILENPADANPPSAPAAFDLIKTIQGISDFSENINLKEIEAQGKILGEKAEAMGKAYGKQMEKQMQPYIAEVTKWADQLSENNDAFKDLQEHTKEMENLPFADRINHLTEIDEYMAPALLKLQEALKTMPKINITVPPVSVHQPAFPAMRSRFTPGAAFAAPFAEERVRIARDMEKANEDIERSRVILKKEIEEKYRQIEYKKMALEAAAAAKQKDHEWAYYFNANGNGNKKYETEADSEDEEEMNSDEEAQAADIKNSKSFTYTLKLPQLSQFKDFGKSFKLEFCTSAPASSKEKNKNKIFEKRVVVNDGDEHIITTSDDEDIDLDNIKSFKIEQQPSKNGKVENVVIIRIIPSK